MIAWLAASLVALFVLAACGFQPGTDVDDGVAQRPLAVPPLAPYNETVDGARVFDLTAQSGQTDFGMGGPADTIGLNQSYLGPTLRMQRGQEVMVNVTNELDEMTTVHWHGMRVPAPMDGGPHQMVEPGRTWQPTWTVDQPAATLWYHSHPHGQTAQQVYRGLAGMLLVDDPANDPGGLPSEYGVDDFPLIVQDKGFTSDGQLVVDPEGQASTGFLGDTLVVNGTVAPYLDVTAEAVRLRILNASNARVYDFGLEDGREFDLIASDGGLLEEPVRVDRVQLSPAERAEIVVRLEPGERVTVKSYPPDLGSWISTQNRFGGGTFSVVELRAAADLTSAPEVPAVLADIPRLDPAQVQQTRQFRISGRAINGRPMDMGRIDEVVTVDEVEIWEITNQDPQPHNFHAHDVQWQVLDVDGVAPSGYLEGWQDTVYVAPRTTVRVIMRFTEHTDASWPYMFHCHLLWHEDIGIMGQFLVVEPGQEPRPFQTVETAGLPAGRPVLPPDWCGDDDVIATA